MLVCRKGGQCSLITFLVMHKEINEDMVYKYFYLNNVTVFCQLCENENLSCLAICIFPPDLGLRMVSQCARLSGNV